MTLTADRLEELEGLAEARAIYSDDGRRMSAYYYSFDATGVREIDAVLSAVASAGKAYHHTDCWSDRDRGPSQVEIIQATAALAAKSIQDAAREGAEAKAERDTLRQAKWEVKHTDTMNDMVLLGLARDSERERAERAESTLQSVQAQLEEAVRLLSRIDRVYGDMQDGAGNKPTELRKASAFLDRALSVQGEG